MSKKIPVNGHVTPYNERELKNNKKAFKTTERGVKPVAKDTNKTRRKVEKPTSSSSKIKGGY